MLSLISKHKIVSLISFIYKASIRPNDHLRWLKMCIEMSTALLVFKMKRISLRSLDDFWNNAVGLCWQLNQMRLLIVAKKLVIIVGALWVFMSQASP